MIKVKKISVRSILLLFLMLINLITFAQVAECVFKDTLFNIDFGNAARTQEFNLKALNNYRQDNGVCPGDGYYAYASQTSRCFNDDWITLSEDHTAGDAGGKMFFVNAVESPAAFFLVDFNGFKPSTKYEFGVWLMNLCKVNGGCSPLPPNILITLTTSTGKKIASFQTGLVRSNPSPYWKKYFAYFTTPADETMLTLKMEDLTNGNCGNDFTMDDITFRECYEPDPLPLIVQVKPPPKPVVKAIEPVVEDKQLKKQPVAVKPIENKESNPSLNQVVKKDPVKTNLPDVILTRLNPVIKTIYSTTAEMIIEVYDNGLVDGDTVTIFHNNELLVSHAGLSEKPIRFRLLVDKSNPHHELTMVADNVGSIPPNTSLMVITANKKRYEVFISSSEQKNAKIVIEWKE